MSRRHEGQAQLVTFGLSTRMRGAAVAAPRASHGVFWAGPRSGRQASGGRTFRTARVPEAPRATTRKSSQRLALSARNRIVKLPRRPVRTDRLTVLSSTDAVTRTSSRGEKLVPATVRGVRSASRSIGAPVATAAAAGASKTTSTATQRVFLIRRVCTRRFGRVPHRTHSSPRTRQQYARMQAREAATGGLSIGSARSPRLRRDPLAQTLAASLRLTIVGLLSSQVSRSR
jgi:hypothetical protein